MTHGMEEEWLGAEEHKVWIRLGMGLLASVCSQLQQAPEGE